MNATQSLQYQTLDPEQDQFRLLHLLPASQHQDAIQCQLTTSTICEPTPYEALSYTWGDMSDTLPIVVDGHAVNITRNLDLALRRLRLPDQKRVLWVDAICIDQDNLDEKAWQVPRMSEIYSQAESVIVWLGEAGDSSDVALDLIQNAAAMSRKEPGVELATAFDLTAVPQSDEEKEVWQERIKEDWQSLFAFFERPWWRRVWVVQEVAFSRACSALCGSREVDWRDFMDSWTFIRDIQLRFKLPHFNLPSRMRILGYIEQFQRIIEARSTVRQDSQEFIVEEKHLIRLLIAFRALEASDPRDHLYGGLSVLYSPGKMGIFPVLTMDFEPGLHSFWKANYEKDTAQVFAEATRFIFLIMDDLRFLNLVDSHIDVSDDAYISSRADTLSAADTTPNMPSYTNILSTAERKSLQADIDLLKATDGIERHLILNLPSWVPNWAEQRICSSMLGDYDNPGGCEHRVFPYKASGSLNRDASLVQTTAGNLIELRTKAVQVGVVSAIGKDFYGCAGDGQFEEAVTMVQSLDEVTTPIGQSALEALLRTLAGNRNPDGTVIQDLDPIPLRKSRSRFGHGRRFFILGQMLALGPRATRAGDGVFIIPGCHVPIVLRDKKICARSVSCSQHIDTGKCSMGCRTTTTHEILAQWHQVIGGAYVHGIMDGECAAVVEKKPELLEVLRLR